MSKGTEKDNMEVVNDQSTESVGLFTQEQVNEIIQKRLSEEKARYKKTLASEVESQVNDRMSELEKREKDMTAQTVRLQCKEYLMDNNMSVELLEVIDTTNFDGFVERANKLKGLGKATETPFRLPTRDPHIYDDYDNDSFTSLAHSKHKPQIKY